MNRMPYSFSRSAYSTCRPHARVWEVVRTVAAPPSIVVKCGGGGVLGVVVCGRLWCWGQPKCRVLSGVVLVVCLCV